MPKGSSLKTRLTLLNTLILVLILGAGGFFLYSTQQQHLFDDLDAELLSISREITCSQPVSLTADNAQQFICSAFDQVALTRASQFAAALFKPNGERLCANRSPGSQLLKFPTHLSAGDAPQFSDFLQPDGKQLRLLSIPFKQDAIQHQLLIAKSTDALNSELRNLSRALILFIIIAAICFASCNLILINWFTIPLQKLAQAMGETTEENIPQPFAVAGDSGKEIQQLVEQYNSLTHRLALSLRKAQQFSADVTHELRTPLTILRGETELALRGDKEKIELLQILSSNQEEISRMGYLIDDLLLLSKSELGEVPLKMEAIDLGSLLEELHFQARIFADEKQIQVSLQAGTEKISLFADALRLRQVFLNLLTNAIKYTPDGGSVTINWSLQKEYARVIIEDTGIGIDNKHQQQIFDRFYRIDKTHNRNDGGSGLGLAIAKWIVDAHHGSIRVCSNPGQGSCFTVMLPLTHRQINSAEEQLVSKNDQL